MNGQFDEELLSAFHDGELDEAERESIEDRLAAAGSEGREILDDYGELSSSLKGLPISQAPTGFRDAVMRQVQGAPGIQPRAKTSPPSRRPLLFWTAGTAAALLIAVGLFQLTNIPQSDFPIGAELADNAAATSDPAMELDMEMGAPRHLDEQSAAAGSIALRAESPSPATIAAEADLMPESAAQVSANDTRLLDLLQSLAEAPDVGEHVDVVQEVGDELVLITFQVVDVIDAYGEFQILLDEVGIMPLNAAGDAANEEAVAENRLRGIYLEASNEEMLAALDEIDSLQSVVLVDTNGVDMASALGVDRDEIPERMQLPEGFGGGGGGNQAIPEADATEPTEPNAAASRASTPPGSSDQPAAEAGEASDEEAPRDSTSAAYRMDLSLPDEIVRAFEQQQQRQDSRQDSRQALEQPVDAVGDQDGQSPSNDARPNEAPNRSRTRFLLILVDDDDSSDK